MARQGVNAERCLYPHPDIGLELACRERNGIWSWEPADESVDDVFLPTNLMADFCYSNFFSRGSVLVPPSSNISVFRDLAGNPSFNNSVAGVVVATTTLYNYGWTIITVPNNTEIDGSHVPADNTLFKDIYAAREFDVRNATQFWTGFRPGLPCQTVTLSFNVLADSPGGVLGTNFSTYSVQAGIFDQCAYDLRLFVGIVGGVGGAIILASVIATIVWVILLIKESKKQHLVEDKYKAMVR